MLVFPFLCNSFLLQGFYNCHILYLLSFLCTHYHFTLRYPQKSNILSTLLSTQLNLSLLFLLWKSLWESCIFLFQEELDTLWPAEAVILGSSLKYHPWEECVLGFFVLVLFHRPLLWFKLCSSKTPILKPWPLVSQNIAVI